MEINEWLETDLAKDIWSKKYQYEGESFDEWLDRVSNKNEDIRKLIIDKKFLFGGRILANRGLQNKGKKITFSNCYVIPAPDDNLESIFDVASKLARTYSYGGGCGIDISKLAPNNAKVNNAAEHSSGSTSFMDLYSLVTGLISQSGRRGALMISILCTHPDLLKFIDIKNDLNAVTKANISIRILDDFMNAVKNNMDWTLYFKRQETGEEITKTLKAKEIFNKICLNNWNMAEPGMLFWDRIISWNLLSEDKEFEYAGVNPCAEEPLPAGGSCLLGSINLSEFVKKSFTDNAYFDFTEFNRVVKLSIFALNEVLDEGLPLHPLEIQRETVTDWRQTGLGIMGLSDMLIKLGLKYGDKKSLILCDDIGFNMARSAIEESTNIALKKQPYPKYKENAIFKSKYFTENTDNSTRELVKLHGLRNSQLLTIAPTGSLSTMLGISGGLEPIYNISYNRKTQSLHSKDVVYKVYTPIVERYMKLNNIKDEKDLPDYFVTAMTLNYKDRIEMQSVWQKHIDASISSTVNVPNEFTIEEIENLYMLAWEKGLKGVTIYRDGCSRSGILTNDKKEEIVHDDKKLKYENVEYNNLPRGFIEVVPEDLNYRKYKLKTGCGSLYFFVGVDEYDGKIYDCFCNTDGVSGCVVNTQAVSRLISSNIRGGVPIEYVVKQLDKAGVCPSFQYKRGTGEKLSNGKSCASAIGNILKAILKEFDETEFIKNNENNFKAIIKVANKKEIKEEKIEMKRNLCPSCGGELSMVESCESCASCGFSKCN